MSTGIAPDLHDASVPVAVVPEPRPKDGSPSRVVVGTVDRTARTCGGDKPGLLDDLGVVVYDDTEQHLPTRRTAQVEGEARNVLDACRPHADAVASLVELAEQSDDPRLQRSAARARASAGRLSAAATRLGRTAQEPTPHTSTADLRRLVEQPSAAPGR
jgi:hypothetical protein